MGTSVASTAETTINTSTESASTLATNVTGTDTSTCDSLDLGALLAKQPNSRMPCAQLRIEIDLDRENGVFVFLHILFCVCFCR